MNLTRGTVLNEQELDQFNNYLGRNYVRAEVVWVETDDNPQALVRVTDGRGHSTNMTVPANLGHSVTGTATGDFGGLGQPDAG